MVVHWLGARARLQCWLACKGQLQPPHASGHVLPARSADRPFAALHPHPFDCCSGLGPSLLGVMHVVIQFPLYESLKARFAARHEDGGPHSEKLNL